MVTVFQPLILIKKIPCIPWPSVPKKKNLIYEEGDLEDDFAVYCQYTDGCADGTGYDQLHGARTFLRGER